jgi:hypothetical protein
VNYRKIYFATTNKSKVERLKKLMKRINKNLIVEEIPLLIDVEETGKDALENSKLKVLPYKNKYKIPILGMDTEIHMQDENINPPYVKRVALEKKGVKEEDLTKNQVAEIMKDYYLSIAKKYGGKKEFFYKDAWSLLLPNGQIRQISYFRGYILTDKPHGELDIYMPMRQIFYSNVTKKYTSQASKEDFYDEFKVQIDALKKLLICHIF